MQKLLIHGGLFALVDDADYEKQSRYKWYLSGGYAIRNAVQNGKHTTLKLHREILAPKNHQSVDHINRNKLDNRRSNLRVCTHSENFMNTERQKNNTSGFRGVTWYKSQGKWAARLFVRKKMLFLGYFDSAEEAAAVYQRAAAQHYGEFVQS